MAKIICPKHGDQIGYHTSPLICDMVVGFKSIQGLKLATINWNMQIADLGWGKIYVDVDYLTGTGFKPGDNVCLDSDNKRELKFLEGLVPVCEKCFQEFLELNHDKVIDHNT